jgi:membrane protease YdiL (CAAX protease family)
LIIFGASILAMPLLNIVCRNEKAVKYVFLLFWSTITLVTPALWIRRYYNLGKEALGIGKGRWSVKSTVLIGVGAALIFFFAELIIIRQKLDMTQYSYNASKILSFTLSIDGFITFLYGPIGEEIFFRGFLFGYMEGRLGFVLGLLLQAVIFGFLHFAISPAHAVSMLFHGSLIGISCGILYKSSDSLYPAIIFHCALNFFVTVAKIG